MSGELVQAMDQCVRHLTTAVSSAALYTPDHQRVRQLTRLAHAELLRALGERAGLSLLRVDDQLAVDGEALVRSLTTERFAALLRRSGIGHLRFLAGIGEDEVQTLVAGLAARPDTLCSSVHLKLGQVEVRKRVEDDDHARQAAEAAMALGDIGQEELARVMEIYDAVRRGRQLRVVGLAEIVSGFIEIFASHADPFLALVPLRAMDEYTFTHSLNVCLLNLAQAGALGIEGELLHDIGLAAMLHDIGKLFVPGEVLNKPDKLTEDEWALIRQHPQKGAEYLLGSPGVPRLAVINAYEHHLHYNLRGYPRVGDDWRQNLCSQMTTIADIFDSLRTRRSYHEPLTLDAVLTRLEELKGAQLHPALTDNFVNLMRRVHPELS